MTTPQNRQETFQIGAVSPQNRRKTGGRTGRWGGHRPSGYRPEFPRLARNMRALYMTTEQISQVFGVSVGTLNVWRAKYKAFRMGMLALKNGRPSNTKLLAVRGKLSGRVSS